MADEKQKPRLTGCFGIAIIVVFGTIALISNCTHKREEAKLSVIPVTFTTITELGSEIVENLDQLISITGYISGFYGDNGESCRDYTGDRCYVVLAAEDPKSTDIPVWLSVLKALDGKRKANAVFVTNTGELNLYTDDKQLLTSNDLIIVTGHLIGHPLASGAFISVDTIESVP